MKIISIIFFLFFSVILKSEDKILEAEKGNGYIFKEDLRHIQDNKYIVPLGNNKYRIFLRSKARDVSLVNLIYFSNKKKVSKKMEELGSTRGKQYFYVDIETKEHILSYYFHLKDSSYNYYFAKNSSEILEDIELFEYNLKNREFKSPKWLNNLTFYQIFIDRFRNGDSDNDPIFNELMNQKFTNSKEKTIEGKDKGKNFIWSQDGLEFLRAAWNSSWTENLEWEDKFKEKNEWYDSMFRHYGGDLRGIIEKLDYIKDLGIDLIYLSPPFYSYSNHKFDPIDLEHISPDFGHFIQTGENYGFNKKIEKEKLEYELLKFNLENSDFKYKDFWTQSDLLFTKLIKEAHKRGLKVIIDFPFTYVSKKSKFFQHVLYHGANSKYSNWFIFKNWNKFKQKTEKNIDQWNPLVEYQGLSSYAVIVKNEKRYRRAWIKPSKDLKDQELKEILEWNEKNLSYESFDDGNLLPILNLNNEEVINYLLKVAKKWILGADGKILEFEDDGIDGFSFDMKKEIPLKFWNHFRDTLKGIKDILIISNSLSTNSESYINNVELSSDLIYNYRFMPSIVRAINDNSPYRIENLKVSLELARLRSPNLLINVLSTWDTERAFSSIINYEFENKSFVENKNYRNINPKVYDSKSENILKIASLIQLTYYGIPLIYYGDEVGMFGSSDPHNRKPMIWKELLPYDKESDLLTKYDENIKRSSVDIDEANQKIFYDVNINENIQKHFKTLLKIRKDFSELFSKGIIKILNIKKNSKDIFAYERRYKNEIIITIINFSDQEEEIEIPVSKRAVYKNLLKDSEEYNIYSSSFKIKIDALNSKLIYSK